MADNGDKLVGGAANKSISEKGYQAGILSLDALPTNGSVRYQSLPVQFHKSLFCSVLAVCFVY